MLYILDHRLKAQNVPQDKCCRGIVDLFSSHTFFFFVFLNSLMLYAVISDVSRALFASRFLKELFRPQEAYNMRQVRAVRSIATRSYSLFLHLPFSYVSCLGF